MRDDIRERILREARFENQVAKAIAAIKKPSGLRAEARRCEWIEATV